MSTTTLKVLPRVGDASLAQQWLEEAQETGDSDAFTRQHGQERFTWYEPLEVHALLSNGSTETQRATACDISEGGIGFQCRTKIPPFTHILVCRAGEMVGPPAMTARSTRTLSGYIVGAEFRLEQTVAAQQMVAKAG